MRHLFTRQAVEIHTARKAFSNLLCIGGFSILICSIFSLLRPEVDNNFVAVWFLNLWIHENQTLVET